MQYEPDRQFLSKLSALKKDVAAYLENFLVKKHPESLYAPIQYTMSGDGKRLRPALLLLAAEALGGARSCSMPAAVGVELLHNFTLVHDDIMDKDDTRRGRPTVHQKWDTDVALLAGDGLVGLAYAALLRSESEKLSQIMRIFTDGIIEVCEGQALDREFEARDFVEMQDYLEMIGKKTACLLRMCTEIGGLVAQGSEEHILSLRRFGENLGMAFQIQDDLLDITADEKKLGKDFGSDVKQKKKTYMYIHAMQHGSKAQVAELQEIYSKSMITAQDILRVRSLFEQIGTLSETGKAVRSYIEKAENSLALLSEDVRTQDLHEFLRMILFRKA